MKVKLIAYTPDPQRTVAAAAKLCYSASEIDQITENLTEESTAAFIEMLSDLGHESPIEHTSFTFAIEGVSRALLAQITRHRIASYSVQSQRYVRKADFKFIVPPAIEAIPEAKEEYLKQMKSANDSYNRLCDILTEEHTKNMVEQGEDPIKARKKAEKIANEDARFVLPNSCDTKIVMTMNARSLHNFFRLRCCSRAQWEIRELATEMLRLCKEVAPQLFSKAGPACASGPCSEGAMSCGKASEMRSFFKSL